MFYHIYIELLYRTFWAFLLCFQQSAGESPGAAVVQDFQYELIFAFVECYWDMFAVCYYTPASPVFMDELAVEPDLNAVVGADAQDGISLFGHLYLRPCVGDHEPLVKNRCQINNAVLRV